MRNYLSRLRDNYKKTLFILHKTTLYCKPGVCKNVKMLIIENICKHPY